MRVSLVFFHVLAYLLAHISSDFFGFLCLLIMKLCSYYL